MSASPATDSDREYIENRDLQIAIGLVRAEFKAERGLRHAEHDALAHSIDEIAKGRDEERKKLQAIDAKLDNMATGFALMNQSQERTEKRTDAIALRLGVVEAGQTRPAGVSGAMRAAAAADMRASATEAELRSALREELAYARREREQRALADEEERRARLNAEEQERQDRSEAARQRRAWVTRIVVWMTVGGGAAVLLAAAAKACGG